MLENIEMNGDGFLFGSVSFNVSESGFLFPPKDIFGKILSLLKLI